MGAKTKGRQHLLQNLLPIDDNFELDTRKSCYYVTLNMNEDISLLRL